MIDTNNNNSWEQQRLSHANKHRHPISCLVSDIEATNASPSINGKVYVDAIISIGTGSGQKRYYFEFNDSPDKYEQAKRIAKRINEVIETVILEMGGTPNYKPCKACGE